MSEKKKEEAKPTPSVKPKKSPLEKALVHALRFHQKQIRKIKAQLEKLRAEKGG